MTSSEPDYTQEALALAQRVVYELSGRRVVWPALTTTEIFPYPKRPSSLLRLTGTPIQTVQTVEMISSEGDIIGPAEFEKINASRVRINIRGMSPGSQHPAVCGSGNQIAVTYTYGAVPPGDIQAGIYLLAEEYSRLLVGEEPINAGCSLPPGVKSVSSRGISLDMDDTDAKIAEGKTGIDSLDNALARYNSTGARSRSRLYSPTFPPTTRTNTHTRV